MRLVGAIAAFGLLGLVLAGSASQAKLHGFSFIVVDGRSGKPIADAEVRWAEDPEDFPFDEPPSETMRRRSERRRRDFCALEELAVNSGLVARSGADGRVVLPTSRAPILLVRKGTLLGGKGCFQNEGDVNKLQLWPDGDLRIHAVDSSGKSVGDLGVLLIGADEENPLGHVERRTVTDRDGLATFRHGFVTIAAKLVDPHDARTSWRVAADTIPSGAGARPLDPTALPQEAITIQLPPTGEIEIAMANLDGSAANVDAPVFLTESGATNRPTELPRHTGSMLPGEMSAPVVGGKAVFRNIALGRQMIAFGSRNLASRTNTLRFVGPIEPGQRVQATIVLGRQAVTWTGRVLDSGGVALGDTQVRVELLNGPAMDSPSDLRHDEWISQGRDFLSTNANGQFAIEYGADGNAAGPPILLLSHVRKDAPLLESRIDLNEAWAVGSHDLGDIRLALAPIHAAGVVVDDAGGPIGGVEIQGSTLNVNANLFCVTNERGEFELRSAAPYSTVSLFARKDGYADSMENVGKSGRADWRIRLERPCKIVVHFRLPPGADPRKFDVGLNQLEHTGTGASIRTQGTIQADGSCVFENLQPGTFQIVVPARREYRTSRMQVNGIVARAGETVDAGTVDLATSSQK